MKKQTKKLIGAMVSLLSLTAGLSSCSGDNGSTTNSDSKSVSIDFWHTFGAGTVEESFKTKIKQFKELIKTNEGVDVEINAEYNGSYDDIKKKVSNGLATGDFPTLTVAYPDHVAYYLSQEGTDGQYVVNLNKFFNDEKIGFKKQAYLGDEYGADDFIESFIQEGQSYAKEGTYSLPYMKSTEVMFYNVDLLQFIMPLYNPEVGDSEVAIKEYMDNLTWEELVELCTFIDEKVKSSPRDFASDFECPLVYDSDANFIITQMYQQKINFSSVGADGKGSIDFDTNHQEDYNKTVNLIKELKVNRDNNMFSTKGLLNKYGSDYFKNERCVFTIGSSGGSGYNFPESSSFKLGITKVPARNNNPLYVSQGITLCMLNNNKYSAEENALKQEYAWKLLKFLTNGQTNCQLCLNGSEGYMPVRYSAYETSDYNTFIREGENYAKTLKVVREQVGNKFFVSATFPASSFLRDEMGAMFTAVLAEKNCDESFIKSQLDRAISNTKLKM